MQEQPPTLRRWILDEHRSTVAATMSAADEIAPVAAGSTPREPLARAIERRDLPARYVQLLRGLQDRLGLEDGPRIVSGPPYVTTSSRGPVLRLPREDERLVITFAVFEVVQEDGRSYRRQGVTPADVVAVETRTTARPGR